MAAGYRRIGGRLVAGTADWADLEPTDRSAFLTGCGPDDGLADVWREGDGEFLIPAVQFPMLAMDDPGFEEDFLDAIDGIGGE